MGAVRRPLARLPPQGEVSWQGELGAVHLQSIAWLGATLQVTVGGTPPPRLGPSRCLTWAQGSPTTLLSLSWSQLGRTHFHKLLDSFSSLGAGRQSAPSLYPAPGLCPHLNSLHGPPVVRSASWNLQAKNRKHERHFPHHKFLLMTGSHRARLHRQARLLGCPTLQTTCLGASSFAGLSGNLQRGGAASNTHSRPGTGMSALCSSLVLSFYVLLNLYLNCLVFLGSRWDRSRAF